MFFIRENAARSNSPAVASVSGHVTTTKSDSASSVSKAASSAPLQGFLEYTEEELVSADYIGNPASSVFDATQTKVLGDKFAKVFSWYDNEWGFSNRMVDLTQLVAKS